MTGIIPTTAATMVTTTFEMTTTNSTNDDSDVHVDPRANLGISWFIGVTIAVIVIVFGTIGNILTIMAYKRNKSLQNTFNLLIANLSVIQLLFCTVAMFFILPGIVLQKQPYNFYLCGVVGYTYYNLHITALINLVTIAINRYVGILHSNIYTAWFSEKKMKVCLVLIWLIAPILHLPLVAGGMISWSSSVLRCTINITNGELTLRYYNLAINLLFQVVAMVIMIYAYSMILKKVKKLQKKLDSHHRNNFSSGNGTLPSSQSSSFIKDKQSTKKDISPVKQKKSLKRSISFSQPKAKFETKVLKEVNGNEAKKTRLKRINSWSNIYNQNDKATIEGVEASSRVNEIEEPGISFNSNFASTEQTDIRHNSHAKTIKPSWLTRHHGINWSGKTTKKNTSRRSNHRLERQLAYSSFFICVSFGLCMLPTSLLFVIQVITNKQQPPANNFIVGAITWLHAVINPFIYGYCNKQYRKEYIKIFKSMRCR